MYMNPNDQIFCVWNSGSVKIVQIRLRLPPGKCNVIIKYLVIINGICDRLMGNKPWVSS